MGRPRHTIIYPDRTKVCHACREPKPWAHFGPRRYHPDGTVKSVQPWCRPCANTSKRTPVNRDNPKLPIAPWVEFLRRVEMEFEDEERFAEGLGVHPRILYRWRHENKHIRLDNADAALCRLGLPHMLRELWPHLYQFDEPLAA